MNIYSFSPFGYEGSLVSVEVDLRRGIPAVDIVGLADGAVKESRERMRSAIRNSGLEFPSERVLISLSPADLKKEGAGFDLAVAIAVLAEKEESNQTRTLPDEDILVVGELELNGKVRPVKGIHAAVSTAHAGGIRLCIVPAANMDEAREVRGMKVFGAENLIEAFHALGKKECFTQKKRTTCEDMELDTMEHIVVVNGIPFHEVTPEYEYADVKNQDFFIRGLQIAAAGGHNVLAFGPPGCGKTLCIQKFPALLPLLTKEESQPVTRIYSIAGLLSPHHSAVRTAPFRQPHQTATVEGICGGGPHCTPGEISLAHNGVLFLDEAAEFKTAVLQMLRVPIETGCITLSRAGRSTVFPARFQLLLAANPCPCGYYGFPEKLCLCSSHSVEMYWKKFSAPFLDRIDIRVQVQKKNKNIKPLSTAELRVGIANATAIQRNRAGKKNANLSAAEIAEYCKCTEKAKLILDAASEKYAFSPRAVSGCLKLARTISDMECKPTIDEKSMKEAILYRSVSGGIESGFGML
ncbi:MAG: YifB family Mg chelatase-like AAA ATPase [Treponema sp.]|nr:YifB family Mg chelatase-like AAA ATPase [Treponema sp.]